jgi:hypothetical protein
MYSMASSRHRAPLTRETLHVIGERNRGNADVQALSWEIHPPSRNGRPLAYTS